MNTKFVVVVFLFFVPPLFSNWNLNYVLTGSKDYNSVRMPYKSQSPYEGTLSEITISRSGIRFVLNLLFCPLSQDIEVPVILDAVIDRRTTKKLRGYLFEGKEKILLSQSDTHWLIRELLQGKTINLEVEMYKATLTPDKFSYYWSKVHHLLINDKIAYPVK